MISRRQIFGGAFALSAAGQSKLDRDRIDTAMRDELASQKIPGMSVGVLLNGEAYMQGYGVRALGSRSPVTPQTVFATGSVTKSFTALAAAMLVEDGKLDWDRPGRDYLPWFRMYDPLATAQINIRDMLCHRSGLPRYDFLRFGMMLDRAELVRRIQFLPPNAGFRSLWQYNNLMYATAGLITAQVAGVAWEDLIENRIFSRLEMGGSNVRVADTMKRDDYAMPHEVSGGGLKQVDFYDYQKFGVGPNGAVNSTAEDLLKYLRYHLAGGPLFEQLHYPQMVVDRNNTYGLGWWIHNNDGTLSHGGSITGFRSWISIDRRRNLCIAVLANGPSNTTRIASRVRETITGEPIPAPGNPPGPPRPAPAEPGPVGQPANPLSAYAGRYESPAFGTCEVASSRDGLTLRFPNYSSALRHIRADLFRTSDRRDVQFLAPSGGMDFRAEPAVEMFRFRRTR